MITDHFEQQAHDIICIIRYGSTGGSVRNDEMRRVANYLRGGSAPRVPVVPVVPRVPVVPVIPKVPM